MELFFSTNDAPAGEAPANIPLRRMRQTAEVLVDSEDWTGVTDAKERRKLQNRLNQRAKSTFGGWLGESVMLADHTRAEAETGESPKSS